MARIIEELCEKLEKQIEQIEENGVESKIEVDIAELSFLINSALYGRECENELISLKSKVRSLVDPNNW